MRALVARWPDLVAAPVRYFAEGWDSTVWEVGEWLFRFPKRAEVDGDFLKETALLRELDLGPVRIPVFERLGEPSAHFPFHFGGYRMIQGRGADRVEIADVDQARFAAQLGRALSRLHAFPVERAHALGVPLENLSRDMGHMRERALANLPKVETDLGDQLAGAVREAFAALPEPYAGPPILLHNDLHHEHILLDEKHALAGIIDWSDAGLGDPMTDLAGAFAWGGRALCERVLAHYDFAVDDGAYERIRFRSLAIGVFCAVHAKAHAKERELAWSAGLLERSLPTASR